MSITLPKRVPTETECPALFLEGDGRGVHVTDLVKFSPRSGRPITCCRHCKVWFVE